MTPPLCFSAATAEAGAWHLGPSRCSMLAQFSEVLVLLLRIQTQENTWKARVFLNIWGRSDCVTHKWGNHLILQDG